MSEFLCDLNSYLKYDLKKDFYGALRYAYFAPILAIGITYSKGGNYFNHILALHRLADLVKYRSN